VYVGLNDVDEEERKDIETLVNSYDTKLAERQEHYFLTVHIKEYGRTGSRKQYAVRVRIVLPGRVLTASSIDWHLRSAVHRSLDVLMLRAKRYKDHYLFVERTLLCDPT
jgi:hypothetical protein